MKGVHMRILSVTCLLLFTQITVADEPKPIELQLSPRLIEKPALKYRLLPPENELKRGNAAPILLRLPWEQTQYMSQVFNQIGGKRRSF